MASTDLYRVDHVDALGSTNDEAMARGRAGDPGGLFVVAATQTGGRGRQGRSWSSPVGNLYASLLLIEPSDLAKAPQLGFVAGVALATTLREIAGGDDRLRLKWPNDVLFAGAKLAGLLLESATLSDGRLACVVGFGVNCRSHPEGLGYAATDMSAATGRPIGRDDVLDALMPHLSTGIERWRRGAGFAEVRSAWLAIAAGVGDTITVRSSSRTVTGRFGSLDSTGRLLVETAEGCVAIDAGDVFLHGTFSGDGRHARLDGTLDEL